MASSPVIPVGIRDELVSNIAEYRVDADPDAADDATVSSRRHIWRDDRLPVTRLQVGADYRTEAWVLTVWVPTDRVPDGTAIDGTIRGDLPGIHEWEPSLTESSTGVTRLADLTPTYEQLADELFDVFYDGFSVSRDTVGAAHPASNGPHLYGMAATSTEVGFNATIPFDAVA